MNVEKYNREVSLLCPTCGCSTYEFEYGTDENIELAKCVSCGREITKDELIQENSENINEHISEIGKDFAKDIEKELKKAFSGFKNLRIN